MGISDKHQITAVFCGAMTVEFLPPQLIYQGKTPACLPRYSFPDDWHVTCTPNHWSNEDNMKEYIELIIIPYVDRKCKELKLSSDEPALAIFDVFKGQQTEDVTKLLDENNIHVVSVPANHTDRLQPWISVLTSPSKSTCEASSKIGTLCKFNTSWMKEKKFHQ